MKKLRRRATWRQSDPRMELVSVLGAALGSLSNAVEGIKPQESLRRCKDFLEQGIALTDFVKGEWPLVKKES